MTNQDNTENLPAYLDNQDLSSTIQTEVIDDSRNPVRRIMDIGGTALSSSIIYLEVLPTNGLIRYGAFGATLAATKDPLLSGAVLGGATVALEGTASLAAAKVLSNEERKHGAITVASKVLEHKKISPLVVSKDGKLLSLTERLLALYAGTVSTMVAKETEESEEERTFQERRKYGFKLAAALGAICTAQGVLYGEGITNIDNPKVVVPIVAATAAVGFGLKKVKEKLRRSGVQESEPNYSLSDEEFNELESELVDVVKQEVTKDGESQHKADGVYSVWLNPYSKFTNLLRTKEASYFPEVKEIEGIEEGKSKFLAIVDARDGVERIVHATTLSIFDEESDVNSGFITVDDLIEEGNFSRDEFIKYYQIQGIDLKKCLSVDTNFRIGDRAPDIDGLKPSDLAYLTTFQLLTRIANNDLDCAVFASINQDSIDSFRRIGLEVYPLMGRTDLVTPESKEGKDFFPVMIPFSENNRGLFRAMGYEVPEIDLT